MSAVEMLRGPDQHWTRVTPSVWGRPESRRCFVSQLLLLRTALPQKPPDATSWPLHRFEIELAEPGRHGTPCEPSAMVRPSIVCTGVSTAERAGHERFVGGVDIGKGERRSVRRDPSGERHLVDQSAGDAVEVVLPGGGVDLALAHDEEVGGVARSDRTGGVKHERLVGTGVRCLDECDDFVELGVAVQLLVERVWRRSAHRCGEERDALVAHGGIGSLVFGDDHNVGSTDAVRRVLRWRLLIATSDHEPHVHVVVHVVAVDCLSERSSHASPV